MRLAGHPADRAGRCRHRRRVGAHCHGYGCLAQAHIRYSEGQLGLVRRIMARATDAPSERSAWPRRWQPVRLGWRAVGYPQRSRRQLRDDQVSGKMDCIDHSTSTTRLLHLLVRRGYLRWHRVLEPQSRNFAGLVPVHWSAVIEKNRRRTEALRRR
jgi:hypothetical protein